MAKFNNIIFDFDGTLVDSRPGIVRSFKRVLKTMNCGEMPDEEIVPLIGMTLPQIMAVLLKSDNRDSIEEGAVLFRKYYQDGGVSENMIYPGVKETLENLKKQSRNLFIVSNKIESALNQILIQHDIKRYFTSAVGTDGRDQKSKKADYVGYTINDHQLNRNQTAIVGDHEGDIAAGQANAVYCVGVSWGYGKKDNLIKAGAHKIINYPSELIEL